MWSHGNWQKQKPSTYTAGPGHGQVFPGSRFFLCKLMDKNSVPFMTLMAKLCNLHLNIEQVSKIRISILLK